MILFLFLNACHKPFNYPWYIQHIMIKQRANNFYLSSKAIEEHMKM